MGAFSCDRCGRGLLVDHDVRYEVRIVVQAGWDPPELTTEDLEKDRRLEIERLLREIEGMDAKTLEEQVHQVLRFDLCPPCRVAWLADPLGSGPDPDRDDRAVP